MRTALISVHDKTGLEKLGTRLASCGISIISTGGTAKALRAVEVPVTEVSQRTGFPEVLGGRVKTLHPVIFGGILGDRSKPDHRADMDRHNMPNVDIVVVNLYPFQQKVSEGASNEEIIENIDIGGVSLLRAAAKNHRFATVVVDPNDYERVLLEVIEGAESLPTEALRRELALKAFEHTAQYDAAIADYLKGVV